MNLRARVLPILTAVFAAYMSLAYGALAWIVHPGFEELEQEQSAIDIARCVQAIDREITNLHQLCGKWAGRDDTYEFISALDDGDVESNLVQSTFSDNNLDLIFLLDADGEVV
jgi:sensor domain CHASE-containing protein